MNLKIRVDHLDREGLDDRPLHPPPPPYLKVWIRHWLVTDCSRIGSHKNAEICLFAICFLWFGINYGQIWLFYALCWISLKNEFLRGYDRLCSQEWHNQCLLQCSYISKIMPIIMLVFVNYAHFSK